MKAAFEL